MIADHGSYKRRINDKQAATISLREMTQGRLVGRPWVWVVRRRPTLPHSCGCSTIGAGGLSFRVRNGSGRFPFAVAAVTLFFGCGCGLVGCWLGVAQWMRVSVGCGQVLGLLVPVGSNPLPGFHVRPINPVFWLGALTLGGVGDLILG